MGFDDTGAICDGEGEEERKGGDVVRGCLQRAKQDKKLLPKGEHTWNIILALGRGGDGKHKQKWARFHGTRKQAEQKLTELTGEVDRGEFVEPSKLTVGTYLDEWLATAIQPRRATNTYLLYSAVVRNHLKPALGHLLLQRLHVLNVERYLTDLKVSPSSAAVHHAILTTALNAAVKKCLVHKNVASLATNKPCVVSHGGDSLKNVWSAQEAHQFLATVKQDASAQLAALFSLLLDSGVRKGELLGLHWRDLNENQLRIERQLMKCGHGEPVFALPKRGGIRSLDLSDETTALLREHKRQQSEVKMANRQHYRDHGFMFAQAWEDTTSRGADLGAALAPWCVNRNLKAFCNAANVRPITVHGLRHTSATLLLAAGVPPHVVQRRLGHKKIEMTLNLYSHVLPSMQADAASRLASLLHG